MNAKKLSNVNIRKQKKRKENKRSIQSSARRKFYQLKHVSCPAGKSKQFVRKISHVA